MLGLFPPTLVPISRCQIGRTRQRRGMILAELRLASLYYLYKELLGLFQPALANLVDTAQLAWDQLDIRHLEHLSETMPHRVEASIEIEGWYTQD